MERKEKMKEVKMECIRRHLDRVEALLTEDEVDDLLWAVQQYAALADERTKKEGRTPLI